ncbi:elongation factor P 5-aminopentanone reductase [Alkalicoccus halolimnae]|uniref:SDR family oxidoreductase n=1 Tax=Alkalicoccus halolimnae TaxID=1667239 RepID=A0A5C7FLT3_9BACI|nr:SDR family oxidoreductase [Alkalicoccus halolimnae]TXF87324.1 SDR family oxidoreductase [Alkalicoccus halolimnae]
MKPQALITGATGTIGEALAEKLAEDYRLTLHYCAHKEKAEQLKEKLTPLTDIDLFQADFFHPEETAQKFLEAGCTPQLIVHCAGVASPALFQTENPLRMGREFNIAVASPAAIIQKVLPGMINEGEGKIIFVSSIWGETGASMEVTYSTCKAAQIGFVKALAKETAPSGIRVNAVTPGAVRSPMMDNYSHDEIAALIEEIPASRLAEPSEIADCVIFLAGPAASYVNGHVLRANGAWYT